MRIRPLLEPANPTRPPSLGRFPAEIHLLGRGPQPPGVLEHMTDLSPRRDDEEGQRTTVVRQPVDERLAYRPAELAALVGLSTKAIYRAIERGELHAVKVANGSRLLVPAAATDEWLEADAVAPRRDRRPRGRFRVDDAARPLGEALARLEDSRGAD